MSVFILLSPLLSTVIVFFFFRILGYYGSVIFLIYGMFCSMVCSFYFFFSFGEIYEIFFNFFFLSFYFWDWGLLNLEGINVMECYVKDNFSLFFFDFLYNFDLFFFFSREKVNLIYFFYENFFFEKFLERFLGFFFFDDLIYSFVRIQGGSLENIKIKEQLNFLNFWEIFGVDVLKFTGFSWIFWGPFYIRWGFLLDSVSGLMSFVVTFISFLVHLYSLSYMQSDRNYIRFIMYLSLFTFFMLFLLFSDNLVTMFVGWEGVGLCSFFLINFWFLRKEANQSALKAILVNRFGDYGITLGMFFFFLQFGSFDYSIIFAMVSDLYFYDFYFLGFDFLLLNFGCFFLFLGAVGKSAQLGLHTWLPDAMEGPTPVSALIHAATMVTAGVYLLIRFSLVFEYSPQILNFVWLFGILTAVFAGSVGFLQNDMKKVIAYSTCSQLGYMVLACGFSQYQLALFHLFNHAFFKALLFLSAGVVIHAMSNEQDMRKMGGLLNLLPFVYIMFCIGSLALVGFPFLAGFYSKEVIIESVFANYFFDRNFVFWLSCLGASFTAFYSFRLLFMVFFGLPNGFKKTYEGVHEPSFFMYIPLYVLGLGSIFVGFLFKEVFVGLGSDFFSGAIELSIYKYNVIEAEFLKNLVFFSEIHSPIIFSFIGFFLSFLVFFGLKIRMGYLSKFFLDFSFFISNKWYFDYIYNRFFIYLFLNLGHKIFLQYLDRGVFFWFFVTLGQENLFRFSLFLSKLHTGSLYDYFLNVVVGFFLLFFLVFYNIFGLYFFEYFFIDFLKTVGIFWFFFVVFRVIFYVLTYVVKTGVRPRFAKNRENGFLAQLGLYFLFFFCVSFVYNRQRWYFFLLIFFFFMSFGFFFIFYCFFVLASLFGILKEVFENYAITNLQPAVFYEFEKRKMRNEFIFKFADKLNDNFEFYLDLCNKFLEQNYYIFYFTAFSFILFYIFLFLFYKSETSNKDCRIFLTGVLLFDFLEDNFDCFIFVTIYVLIFVFLYFFGLVDFYEIIKELLKE